MQISMTQFALRAQTHFALFLAALALTGCATPSAMLPSLDDATLSEERREIEIERSKHVLAMRARLWNVANRVNAANASICKKNVSHDIGVDIADAAKMPPSQRIALQRRLKGQATPKEGLIVLSVAKGAPAAKAGLKAGDVLLDAPPSATRTQKPGELGMRGYAPKRISYRRGGKTATASLQPRKICNYRVLLALSPIPNAYADGEQVVVTASIMALASGEDELALVYGHELAHNVMRHVQAKRGNAVAGAIAGGLIDVALAVTVGADTGGGFSQLGGGIGAGAFSQTFESEADYVGGYFMSRAGYNLAKGPGFWAKMATASGGAVRETASFSDTHPSGPERAAVLRRTHDEIRAKRAAGKALVPNIKTEEEKAAERRTRRASRSFE